MKIAKALQTYRFTRLFYILFSVTTLYTEGGFFDNLSDGVITSLARPDSNSIQNIINKYFTIADITF